MIRAKCFLITPLNKGLAAVRQTIRDVLSDGLRGIVIDKIDLELEFGAGHIPEEIRKGIADADFCIADLTGLKPNVLWEVGYAMACGKPVLLLLEGKVAALRKKLPFDIFAYRTLSYRSRKSPASLKKVLSKAVEQTVRHLPAPIIKSTVGDATSEFRLLLGNPPVDSYPYHCDEKVQVLERRIESSRNKELPPDTIYYLASSAFLKGDYNRALRLAKAVVDRNKTWHEARYLLADVCGRRNEYDQAIEHAAKCLPNFRHYYLRAALLLMDLYRLNGAGPNAVQMASDLGSMPNLQDWERGKIAYTYLDVARFGGPEFKGCLEKAEGLYNDLVKARPESASAHFGLALVAEARGAAAGAHLAKAYECQSKALGPDAGAVDHFDMARILVVRDGPQDRGAALEELKLCIKIDPTFRVYAGRDRELDRLNRDPRTRRRFAALTAVPDETRTP